MRREFGEKGFVVLNTGESTTRPCFGILVSAEAELGAVTFADEYDGDDSIVGEVLPAGLFVPMRTTALTNAAGTILAYFE